MIECREDDVIDLYQPLPSWLLTPITSGTFPNGASKVGYLPSEAVEIEQHMRLADQERAEQ